MKKTFRAAVLSLAITAVPCMSAAQDSKPEQTAMIDLVKERGVLIAGVKNDTPNFGFINEQGENEGFEIDLIKDIARRLDVDIKLVPAPGATRIQMLEQGRVDLLIATVSHYRSRDEVVDFSIGYLYTPQTLLVKKESDIKGLDDLDDKRVATVMGSAASRRLPAVSPNVKTQTFPSWPEAFFALDRDNVDAVATDTTILHSLRLAASNPEDFVVLGTEGTYSGDYYAIAVRQNDSKSRDAINFLLQDQWLDGTWQKYFDKWLGKDSELNLVTGDFDDFKMTTWNQ